MDTKMRDLASFIEYGYSRIITKNIEQSLIEVFYSEWQDFFESSNKEQYQGDIKWPIGYIGKKPHYQGHYIPYEDFYYHPSASLCPSHLQDITNIIYQQLTVVANNLLSELFLYLQNKIDEKISQENVFGTVMRIIYYPQIDYLENYYKADDSTYILNTAHKDHNFLTLLLPATSLGLEVVKQEDNYKEFDARDGEVVLMCGEQLEEISNRHILAPLHRVICSNDTLSQKPRLSTAFFIKICDI